METTLDQFEATSNKYIDIFNKVRQHCDNDDVALEIVRQAGKDQRTEMLMAGQRSVRRKSASNEPSPKQLSYLRSLGVEIPENITKADASRLIDEAVAKVDAE